MSLKMKEMENCIFYLRALIKAMDGFNQSFPKMAQTKGLMSITILRVETVILNFY